MKSIARLAFTQENLGVLSVNGVLVTGHMVVLAALVASGLILRRGYLMFGIAVLSPHTYPTVAIWLLMMGALFGIY